MKNVIVLGIMGHGKSQLCNFLDGDLTNSKYKVGHHNNSQTQMHDLLSKDKKDLIILRNKYNLIYSCGGGEKYEKDIDNLEEYTKYLTKIGGVNCIIFVFNYTVRAEKNDLSEYLRKLATIFTPKEFYERLIIVLTNFPNKPKIKDKQKRDIYKQEINDIMRKAFEIKNENLSKEIFFIDTDPYEDDNGNNKYFNEVQIKTRDAIIDKIEFICNFTPQAIMTKYLSNINPIDKRSNLGEYFYYQIKGSNEGSVWGYEIYTDDSNIAKAAVLDGKCKLGEEKIVKIKIENGYSYYPSVYKNGINSFSWDYWPGSYIFVDY